MCRFCLPSPRWNHPFYYILTFQSETLPLSVQTNITNTFDVKRKSCCLSCFLKRKAWWKHGRVRSSNTKKAKTKELHYKSRITLWFDIRVSSHRIWVRTFLHTDFHAHCFSNNTIATRSATLVMRISVRMVTCRICITYISQRKLDGRRSITVFALSFTWFSNFDAIQWSEI